MNKNHQLLIMLLYAALAALLLLIIIFFSSQSRPLPNTERVLIGSLFIIFSLGGIYSAFRPGRLRRVFLKSDAPRNTLKPKHPIDLAGHHPVCTPFKNHSFHYKNHVFCTGCYGLAIGSIIAIIVTSIYLRFNISLPADYSTFLLLFGLSMLTINYIETLWYHNTIVFHLLSNSLLIIGFLCIVLSTIELTGNASYGIIAIIFSVLWLNVRIHLSQYNHRRICHSCSNDCKYFY